MHSRILPSARLVARFTSASARQSVRTVSVSASTGKVFARLAASPSPLASSSRAFASSSSARSDKPVDTVHEGSTASEAAVRADQTDVDPREETSTSSEGNSIAGKSSNLADVAESSVGETTPNQSELDQLPAADERIESAAELAKRTVFVGGLSWNVDNEWLRDEIVKVLDNPDAVLSTRVARNPMGKSKGFAFIELADAELALQLSAMTADIDHRTVEFRLANEPSQRERAPRARNDRPVHDENSRRPPSDTVWVGNLAWVAEEGELEDIFSQFGTVRRVSIPRDNETGRGRGIAYIEFASQEDAESAVAAGENRELAIHGRPFRLDFASASRPHFSGGASGREGRDASPRRREGFGRRDGDRRGNYGRDSGRDSGRERRGDSGRDRRGPQKDLLF